MKASGEADGCSIGCSSRRTRLKFDKERSFIGRIQHAVILRGSGVDGWAQEEGTHPYIHGEDVSTPKAILLAFLGMIYSMVLMLGTAFLLFGPAVWVGQVVGLPWGAVLAIVYTSLAAVAVGRLYGALDERGWF